MSLRHFFALTSILSLGLLDAGLKLLALNTFPAEQTVPLQSVLSFAVHKNYGVAFNLPVPFAIVLPLTVLFCLGFAYLAATDWRTNPARSLAALAAVSGATNNGLDRLINGFTTDYLIFFQTSAVNLSDGLILLGILSLLWYDKRTPSQSAAVT